MPALVSASKRVFARVVEPKPATIFACSRSTILMMASSSRRCRSRFWITIPRLFPRSEDIIGFAMDKLMTFRDIAFDMGAHPASRVTRPIEETGGIDLWIAHGWDADFYPAVRTAFHNATALGQVLQPVG